MDFSKFDNAFDIEGLKKDIKEAEQNGQNYEDVPTGEYVVNINKLELTESKKGDPMLTCWFKILEGDHKNQLIFMNQVIKQGFQVHIANEFLRSLGIEKDIHFETFRQYGQLIFEIENEIEDQRLEYALAYGMKNGFSTFKITQVFEPSF